MDRDRADAERVLESLMNAFGRNVIPIELPIGAEKNLTGVIDLVRMKAYTYEMGGNGKGKETDIPANLKEQAQEAHERLVELVAEGDDKLMEKFFESGHAWRRRPGSGAAQRDPRRQDFPGASSASGLGNIGADALWISSSTTRPRPPSTNGCKASPSRAEWRRAQASRGGLRAGFALRL